ncbi:MAG: sigma-70 family RNA polymerase sigma factor [Planctomycetota bacterium]
MSADPRELFERYRARPDRERLKRLLEGIQGRVYAVCFDLLKHRQDAEDATQDALIKVCREFEAVRDTDRFEGWLYRIAFRTALDARRKRMTRGRHERAREAREAVEPAHDDRESTEHVHEAMNALEDGVRALLAEHYFAGTSIAAIARSRGLSTNAIWKKIERGRRALRERLESAGYGVAVPGLLGYLDQIQPPTLGRSLVDETLVDAAMGALPASFTTTGGILLMGQSISKSMVVSVLVAALLGVGVIAWSVSDGPSTVERRTVGEASEPRRERSSEIAAPPVLAPLPASRGAAPLQPETVDERARLVGLVVDVAGSPVPDVEVELSFGRQAQQVRRTDVEGRFEFGFDDHTIAQSILVRAGERTVGASEHLSRMLTPGVTEEVTLAVGFGGTIRGVVLDPDHRPVPGIAVHAFVGEGIRRLHENSQRVTQTDGQGEFELSAIGPRFTVFAEGEGYGCRARYSGRLAEGARYDEIVLRVAPEWVMEGVLLDPDRRPVAGERLELEPEIYLTDDDVRGVPIYEDVPPRRFVVTDEAGKFVVDRLAPVAYRTQIDVPGTLRDSVAVNPPEEGTVRKVEFVLRVGWQRTVVVSDEAGASVPGVRVWTTGVPGRPAVSDADGVAKLAGLRGRGKTTLLARRAGFALEHRSIEYAGDGAIELTLGAESEIAGVFLDAQGAPLPHARITIESSRKIGKRWPQCVLRLTGQNTTLTDRFGRFRFGELFEGEFEITAQPPVEAAAPQVVTARAGDPEVTIVFDPRPADRAHFTGRVVDARTGTPIEAVTVTAIRTQGPGTGGSGKSVDLEAPDGVFELLGLEPGFWEFEVQAPGYHRDHEVTDEVGAGEHRLDFALHPLRTVRLRILDAEGNPISGAELVFLYPSGGTVRPTPTAEQPNGEVTLDSRGETLVVGLPATQLRVCVRVDGVRVGEAELTVDEDRYTAQELRLLPQ